MTSEIENAISSAAVALLSPWLAEGIAQIASQHLPDAAGGRYSWLLRGDAKLVQMRWVVEAVTGPELHHMSFTKAQLTVFRRALDLVDAEFREMSEKERFSTATKLQETALALWWMRNSSIRQPIAKNTRYELIFEAREPHCWICGNRFSESALEAFVDGRKFLMPNQSFVDFAYPRGRNSSDFAVTIDHVLPVTAGGSNDLENLRLCCSWCNLIKSDALDIYRSAKYHGDYSHPTMGDFRLPNYGWIARLLAMTRGCSKCGSTQEDGPLVVAASSAVRQLNPAYLRAFCNSCDPWRDNRMVPARSLPR